MSATQAATSVEEAQASSRGIPVNLRPILVTIAIALVVFFSPTCGPGVVG